MWPQRRCLPGPIRRRRLKIEAEGGSLGSTRKNSIWRAHRGARGAIRSLRRSWRRSSRFATNSCDLADRRSRTRAGGLTATRPGILLVRASTGTASSLDSRAPLLWRPCRPDRCVDACAQSDKTPVSGSWRRVPAWNRPWSRSTERNSGETSCRPALAGAGKTPFVALGAPTAETKPGRGRCLARAGRPANVGTQYLKRAHHGLKRGVERHLIGPPASPGRGSSRAALSRAQV
jgi:hypothetical protein